jgi:serine/threonine-protein kinase
MLHGQLVIEQIGNYRVTDEIGSGGMAVVYKGVQESLKRTVAIKALKSAVSDDKVVVARFEREATSIASLQHENIITVYDFFRERGALFIVMEYVEGIDLYDLLERCDRLPGDVAAIITLQTARALDYAHFRGVIHRDVKPANIILSKLGTVKLTDFGIARIEESDLTEYGVGIGTPAYMSPEQILGRHLDHRSDLFSLGIVLYQMVTGRKPFVEDDGHTAMEKIQDDIPARPRALVPSLSKHLEQIILTCLEKQVQDRYGATQELIVALEQLLAASVDQNYRARLLVFLREQGVISADETQATLHPALIGDRLGRPPPLKIKHRHRWPVGLAIMLLLTAPLVAVLAWRHIAQGREQILQVPAKACPRSQPRRPVGYLRVLAYPWARVEIDAKIRGTTPLEKPLPVTVGRHRVRLLNPYFKTVAKEVEIVRDATVTMTEVLQRSSPSSNETQPQERSR